MRRFVPVVCLFGFLWAAAVVTSAQAKPTIEQLDRVMKKDGPAQQALVKAIVSGNQAAAKQNLGVLQQGIAEARTFWVANKRTDALDFTKTVLQKIDAIDKMLNAPTMDSAAALAAVQDLNKSCTECHKVYRTTDDDGHFILKPGSVPGY